MPPILVIALIVAVVTAYTVFALRWYRRREQAKHASHSTLGAPAARDMPMPTAPPLMPLGPDGSVLSTAHPSPSERSGPGTGLPDMPPEAPPHVTPPPFANAPDAAPAASDHDPNQRREGRPPVSRVVDLVAGIRLPEDLVPLVDVLPHDRAFDRAVFVTVETPADTIGPALAGALEAISTEMRWDELRRKALLRRGEHSGWLEIHTTATGIVPLGTPKFPTLPDHAVIVEFWTEGSGI